MKILRLLAVIVAICSFARAVDTTPPTLNITHTWIEKAGTRSNFKMLLDPKDETGLLPQTFGSPPPANNTIWFRSALNNPKANLSALPWNWWPWQRGVPFEIAFTCTACVIEIQARDAAGNASAVQRRVFSSPFPYSTAPDTGVKLELSPTQSFSGAAIDCRGLFSGDTDGTGIGSDIIQVDRASGKVTVRRQEVGGWVNAEVITLTSNTIEDSAAADYDKDGRLDLAMIVGGTLKLYHNDGVVSSTLTFTEVTLNSSAVNAMNLSTRTNVAFGDLSGEGKPELLVAGTDSGGEARIGWLDNNNSQTFLSGNNAIAPAGSGSGRVAVGDVNGDGFVDAVMIDPTNKRVIVFKNDAGARLSGDDDAVTSKRPFTALTGPSFESVPAKSIAVGDVTGDGRADVVVMCHWWASTNPGDSNDTRMHPLWQLLDSRGTSLHAGQTYQLPEGPFAAAPVDFPSDVMLRDLNNDRFPEIIVTSPFEPGTTASGGIHALRLTPFLDATNQLISFEIEDDVVVATNITNPHRLTSARFSGNRTNDILLANNNATTPLAWIVNSSRESTAPVAILGAASTDTDPDGTDGPNGTKTYTVYPNGLIEFSLTIINNTASPLTNAIFDSLLPPSVTAENLAGGTLVTSGTSKYLRWTETIPANTAITKSFTARMVPTAVVGAIILPKNNIKYGTTNVSSYMPKVTLDEPITFALLSANSTSDTTASVVHFGEFITYRMRLSNRGKTAITNTVISTNIPTGTIFSGPVSPVPGTTQTLTTGNKRIDITVTSLAPESYQDVFVNVEARGSDNSLITNSAMTAQRPSGSKRTLATVKTTIKPAIDVEWYSVYSEFSPRDQSAGEPLKGTQVHFGEIIRYRPKLINRSANTQLNVLIGLAVPSGTIFDGPVSDPPGMTRTLSSDSKSIIFTLASFPGSTYNSDGSLNTLSTDTNARLDVECRAADYATITQSSGTVAIPVSGRAIVKMPTYTFLVRPALEIDVKTVPSMTSVKPGDSITYEIQAQNWGINGVTSAKVVNTIPYGTKIKNAQQDDGTGTASPFRSGDFIGAPINPVALSPTSSPAYIADDQLLVWNLGQVDPGQRKVMRYSVTIATDLESAYFYKGISNPLSMMNTSYNFVGTANTGKRIFAFMPISTSLAAPANADPYYMNAAAGKAPSINVEIDTNAPLPKPQLKLNKHAIGQRIIPDPAPPAEPYAKLPSHQEGDDFMFDVDNDSTKVNDAVFNYVLRYTNEGGASATNVRVKDVLPANTTFLGFLAKDNALVQSFAFSHFYASSDFSGQELDMNIAANITKVRSFDLYGGNLPIGESHAFTYQVLVPDAVPVGTLITSTRGGTTGVSQGLNFTRTAGYYLEADELHFPVNGGPQNVKVKITAPASFVLLMPRGFKSAPGIASGAATTSTGFASIASAPRYVASGDAVTMATEEPDSLMLTMPYDVRGDAGAAPLPPLSNMKMIFTIPKGYKTDDAYVNGENDVKLKSLNATATVENSSYVSALRQSDGTIKVSFPLDGVPFAWPTAHIIFDPLYQSSLVESGTNVTKGPAYVTVSLTGNYNGTKTIPEVKSQVRIDARANAAKDSKVFVGRCAPISVKRGDTFSYTIFAGNLTDHVFLSSGSLTMKVPTGCDFVSCSDYKYNYYLGAGPLLSDSTDHRAQGTYSSSTRTVTWPIKGMNGSEGGAVTLTVKVQESFSGDRIDDNTCLLKVGNAMPKSPGPQSVVVRAGDEDGQLAEITQRWLQGAKIKHNDGVTTELKKSFALSNTSCGISIGGADVLQMMNGVNLIPLPDDRVMLVGPPSKVTDVAGGVLVDRHVLDNPMMSIIVGPGTTGSVSLINASLPRYAGVVAANQILTDLGVPGLNIISDKGANVLVGNGGNLLRAGASDFTKAGINGLDAPALILPGGTALLISNMTDAKLIGHDGSTIVAGGGGNAVTGEGGKVIAPGPAGVVANDGAGVVANDGAGLIGHDGSTLIGHDGSTLIGHDGSTLIGKGGANVVANDGAGLVGQDGASIVAGGGLNATQVSNGNN